ncbi:AT-rich interactive domain-containing protein 4A [Prorops nasuta]|uniref:AT-rich interactive domain-containing protein 4A n=1 Tax=Prorops nasuta TaxID=863751 RepID=UPI0034D0030B
MFLKGDDPPYLSVGTEVSAKYKGAFCEAKIQKVVRSVKCRVTYKQGLGTATVTDEQIKGTLRVGASVEARHNERKEFVDATITKIQDCSQYTVVFDDGDITTLRRTALCLKSGRHFAESETLDQLPLTHPEHFGNPVIGGRRGRRSRHAQDESSDDDESPPRGNRESGSSGTGKEGMETEPEIGRVVCVELGDKKKKDNWFPGLVVAPTAQDTVRIRVRDDYLVRSFKDARYYTVPKKEATEFTKELVNKVENNTLKVAVEKALLFLEKNELPPHWDRDSLFGNAVSIGNSDSDGDLYSDSSDDEPREEKDHFVAQLYKFMDDRGTPINNCPMIGSEDIDLYRLFRAVYKLGGYNRVTNQNQWKSITRRLSFTMQNSPSTHNLVKQAYKKFLHSFEDFYRKLGCTMVNHPRGSTRKPRPGRSLIRDKDRNTPVPPPQTQLPKVEKEEEEKKPVVDEDKKEKKEVKKETIVKEEEVNQKVRKKDEFEESISGQESDINIEGEGESSSSEKSQKSSAPTSVQTVSRPKMKAKEEPARKKLTEKQKKTENKKQEKKEEKSKEEETAKTRSKAKDDPNNKTKTSSDSRETRTPSREPEKRTVTKQRRLTEEELKRRGRKRAKEFETEKSRNDEQSVEVAPCYKGSVELGDRLKVYYGPTHESKVTYEAKVIDMEKDGSEPIYLVHYTGWNTRYDEWIKASRIAQNFTQAQSRVKRIKTTQRPQTPSTNFGSNTNRSSKNTSNLQQSASQGRRRAQSVAPLSGSNSTSSSRDSKKDDKEKEKESQPIRSTTPLSVASSSSRTKSPATPATNRQTRTRNADLIGVELRRRTRRTSGHTDISAVSESEDSDAYESDTEPEQTKTRSRGADERKRREAKSRAEERIKPEENSDGEEEKDNIEEPRRGRRIRKTIVKNQGIKSEPDSDEEQPKGRDFDLNQIRSELKGFDKAVKMEMTRIEPDPEEQVKPENKENVALSSLKIEKSTEVPKTELVAETKPIESTEDIYEFKEPEPFEFEVRSKRDSNGDKDKLKKRVFEEDPKSPKKRQKTTLPTLVKDTKPEVEDTKKKARKVFVKKNEEPSDVPIVNRLLQPVTSACEEAFDKLCEAPAFNQQKSTTNVVEEPAKVVNSLDLLFSDLPGDDDGTHEDSEDRLIISETEVSEAEQENLFTYQQEIFPSNDSIDTMELEKQEKIYPVEVLKEIESSTIAPNKSLVTVVEQKQNVKHSPRPSPELRTLDTKLLDMTPVLSPALTAPAPISARLPATSTIEEKLSAAAMAYRNKSKDNKKEEEGTDVKKPVKEIMKKDLAAQKKKEELMTLKNEEIKERVKEESTTEEEQRREVVRTIKQKEDELQQLKLRKATDIRELIKVKSVSEQKKIQDNRNEVWKSRLDGLGSKGLELKDKEKKRRRPTSQETDSADSSDSEQRLIIDNEEPQDVKVASIFDSKIRTEVVKTQDVDRTYSKIQGSKVQIQNQNECISEVKYETVAVAKADEEVETISSLLCEEEIPGSPAPTVENVDQREMGTPCNAPKVEVTESSIVLMEMPFASAPTSSQSASGTVVTLSMTLPKTVDVLPPASLAIQQNITLGPRQQQPQHLPALMPAQRRESNEAAPVMDNTPPTTPDSSISNISGSPREERVGNSSPTSEDTKHNRDSSEPDNDSGGKAPGFSEDDAPLNTEGNIADRALKPPAKRSLEDAQSPKKRKRSRKHSECANGNVKKPGKQSGRNPRQGAASDSDDTSEGSNLCSINLAPANNTNISNVTDLANYSNRSPRPMKYNFYVELDPELDGSQRIAVLQQKLTELRKTYNAVKVELAAIERRRKKLRRREREAIKAAKAEMQQACS